MERRRKPGGGRGGWTEGRGRVEGGWGSRRRAGSGMVGGQKIERERDERGGGEEGGDWEIQVPEVGEKWWVAWGV